MDKGIFVALSGAILQERRMEALTDNLANVNTSGFKGARTIFEDSMADAFRVRTFAGLDDVVTDTSQGPLQRTERNLDVALKGDGFFVVETQAGIRYTRDGSFTLDKDGNLVTRDGSFVMGDSGKIKLPGTDVKIDAEGGIKVNGAAVGRLKLVDFTNPVALRREGSHFFAPAGAGEIAANPNTQVEQGYIEASNVNAVRAMTTMIEAMRSYETHAKLIQSMDDMTRRAVEEVGRTA